jgi:hypothetical protein
LLRDIFFGQPRKGAMSSMRTARSPGRGLEGGLPFMSWTLQRMASLLDLLRHPQSIRQEGRRRFPPMSPACDRIMTPAILRRWTCPAAGSIFRRRARMIISHRHGFIFLHCRKAAGSSVTVSLSRYLGDDDIQIGSIVDAAAHGISPPRGMVRRAMRRPSAWALWRLLATGSRAEYLNAWGKSVYNSALGPYAAHASAAQVSKAFADEWRRYTSFCVIRNPWDKTVSDYHWRIRGAVNPPSFERYVEALGSRERLGGIVPKLHSNWSIYTIGNEVAVDRVLKFESLVEDLTSMLGSLAIQWDRWLPHEKKSASLSGKRPHYRDLYTPEMCDKIADLYRNEIELGGYSY